jgi:hypothetical protein
MSKPLKSGYKWNEQEDNQLLHELNENIHIDIIAKNHNRTISAIESRRKHIVYKLYSKKTSIDDIISKTKLEKYQIFEIIDRIENKNKIKKPDIIPEIKKSYSLKNEITDLKNNIQDLKNTLNELIEIVKSINK